MYTQPKFVVLNKRQNQYVYLFTIVVVKTLQTWCICRMLRKASLESRSKRNGSPIFWDKYFVSKGEEDWPFWVKSYPFNEPSSNIFKDHIMCKQMDLIKVGPYYDGNVIFYKYFSMPLTMQCKHLHLLQWEPSFPLPLKSQLGEDTIHDDIKIMKILQFSAQDDRALSRFLKIFQR